MEKMQHSAKRIPGRQAPENRAALNSALSAAKLAKKHTFRPSFERAERKRDATPARMIAWDLETTKIQAGTPRPLYITAYSEDFSLETEIKNMGHLTRILCNHFLTDDKIGVKFVAWNSNRYDAYFMAAALLSCPQFRIIPYMTRSKSLRGLRVERVQDDEGNPLENGDEVLDSWEFLDGIAMLGLAGVSLEKFLANFAPDLPKLSGAIDFEREQFNPKNKRHREYAMRDSVGLYWGMKRAQQIMLDTFNQPLSVTMGAACIKIFQAHIPRDVVIDAPIPEIEVLIRDYVMRGGFCYCVRRYDGPVWKYDINQAYAAAMRESKLPAGGAIHIAGAPKGAYVFIARIEARKRGNKVPFYYRTNEGGRMKTRFSGDEIAETWITSIEYAQLLSEGWQIKCFEHWGWAQSFDMREYVDKLETLRTRAEGGPSGPIGTMVKATGNHSYGKTVENIEPLSYVIAAECPDDYLPFYGDGADPFEHVFYKIDLTRRPKAYHQPQLGAFITAHVRMVLRRAALIAPDSWLYADTDCVVFDSDVTAKLDIDAKRYGAWKIEESGARYQIIAKKVYAQVGGDKPKRSAKGLHVKKLSAEDFARWLEGEEPEQVQTQVQNFLAVLCGAEMFREQRRKGTRVEASKSVQVSR